jgi:phage FluMu protein Com
LNSSKADTSAAVVAVLNKHCPKQKNINNKKISKNNEKKRMHQEAQTKIKGEIE